MKSLKYLFFFLLITAVLGSCEKIFGDLNIETLSGKWIIAGSGEYESFEYREDLTYIVIRIASSEEETITGSYEIKGLNKILMDGFGKVKVTSIDEEMIHFTLTLEDDPDTEMELSATKVY
jgi:hypothetical protein